MMATIQARLIMDIPWGGVANQGQHILFDLRFADGQSERYACPISTVPLLMGNLTQYASMAEAVRSKAPDRALVEAAPYRVTEVVSSGYSSDGSIIAVNYSKTHGFPVSIALTPDQARQTIEFLQRELLLAAQPRGGNKTH
jgi:hypothetical protein